MKTFIRYEVQACQIEPIQDGWEWFPTGIEAKTVEEAQNMLDTWFSKEKYVFRIVKVSTVTQIIKEPVE